MRVLAVVGEAQWPQQSRQLERHLCRRSHLWAPSYAAIRRRHRVLHEAAMMREPSRIARHRRRRHHSEEVLALQLPQATCVTVAPAVPLL